MNASQVRAKARAAMRRRAEEIEQEEIEGGEINLVPYLRHCYQLAFVHSGYGISCCHYGTA